MRALGRRKRGHRVIASFSLRRLDLLGFPDPHTGCKGGECKKRRWTDREDEKAETG